MLERGVDVKRIALSLEELAVESLHYLTETAIAGAFQIPPIMAGLGVGLARGTFSNYETAERAYTMHTLIPLWRMRDGELNSSFVSAIDDSVYLETDFSSIAALSENNDALWARAASGFSNQLLTLNEARSLIGYPPLEEEQNDQISSPPKQLQRSQLFKSTKYVDPEYIKTTIVDGIEGKLLEPSWLINKEAEHDTYRQLQFDMNMRTQEYLEAQYAKAAELIATNPTISILELEEQLDLRGEELKALIEPIFRELFVVAFDDVSDLLAVAGLSYEVYQAELEEVIDELGNLVSRVSDTTVQDIRN
ncbi:phage portal protein, partial [bacterium]|nr:phage portal protein [bacterium]